MAPFTAFLLMLHAAVAATALNGSVHAILGSAKIPFPLPNADACTNGNLNCPLNVGTEYVYQAALEIPSYTPTVCQERAAIYD